MNFTQFIGRISDRATMRSRGDGHTAEPPTLSSPHRFPYGPFRFKIGLQRQALYEIHTSSDLKNWLPIAKATANETAIEYVDSDASKFGNRFYRVVADGVPSANVLGYASMTLPPGFSMIANPLYASDNTIGALFKDWPDGTTLNKFDTGMFRLTDNGVKNKTWMNPHDKLVPGEGAIFFNPTPDYRPLSFVGDVVQGNLNMPIPAGFSVRSSLVPQHGQLAEDLGFPIADGDVVHLFDRDRKKYVLYPHQNGKWTAGSPIVSIGESFWIAKTAAANWIRSFHIAL
jgi:hypothetical protein